MKDYLTLILAALISGLVPASALAQLGPGWGFYATPNTISFGKTAPTANGYLLGFNSSALGNPYSSAPYLAQLDSASNAIADTLLGDGFILCDFQPFGPDSFHLLLTRADSGVYPRSHLLCKTAADLNTQAWRQLGGSFSRTYPSSFYIDSANGECVLYGYDALPINSNTYTFHAALSRHSLGPPASLEAYWLDSADFASVPVKSYGFASRNPATGQLTTLRILDLDTLPSTALHRLLVQTWTDDWQLASADTSEYTLRFSGPMVAAAWGEGGLLGIAAPYTSPWYPPAENCVAFCTWRPGLGFSPESLLVPLGTLQQETRFQMNYGPAALPGGDFVFGGTSNPFVCIDYHNQPNEFAIARVDPLTLAKRWERRFGAGTGRNFVLTSLAPDPHTGGIVAAGVCYHYGSLWPHTQRRDAFVLRLDSLGNPLGAPAALPEPPAGPLALRPWPNPLPQGQALQLPAPASGCVMDAQGRELARFRNTHLLPTHHLPPGLYTLRLAGGQHARFVVAE